MIERRRRTVVVGGGVAGCVLASRLSRVDDVVLIEAGSRVDAASVPVDVHAALATPGLTWPGVEARRVSGGPMVAYPVARGVGGGSLVNGLVVERLSGPLVAEEVGANEFGPVDRALVTGLGARAVRLSRRSGMRAAASNVDLEAVDLRHGATVDGLVVDGGRAIGVEIAGGEGDTVVKADRVVLAAGAFASPRILLAAGLGGPAVGRGVQDHPSVVLPLDGPGQFDGPVSGAVARFDGIEVLALNRLPDGQCGVAVALLDPASRGRVTIEEIDLNLLDENTDDLARLTAGVSVAIGRLSDALAAEGLAFADEIPKSGDISSLRDWVRSQVATADPVYTHAASSCSRDVVDEGHAVGGVEGLFVVDASTLPGVPTGSMMNAILDQVDVVSGRWMSS
ncbi:MAG: GMC family oxidoreductase N-terminal domain-containing protein [Ilumatobacteraceae bacterium]